MLVFICSFPAGNSLYIVGFENVTVLRLNSDRCVCEPHNQASVRSSTT